MEPRPRGAAPSALATVRGPISPRESIQAINPTGDSRPKYRKYLPIRIRTTTILALVDSGNSITNACSASMAKRLGLLNTMHPYNGPRVGTAKKGQLLHILGVIPEVELRLLDSLGREHWFRSQLTIVDKLSSGLNLSGPFLHEHAIDKNLRMISSSFEGHGWVLWG